MRPVIIIILSAAEMFFAYKFIMAGWPESTKKGFAFKMLASAVFVAAGVYAFMSVPAKSFYSKAILAGLVAGFVGDIFLTLDPFIKDKKSKMNTAAIIIGGLCFLFGHICYIGAFVKEMLARNAFSPAAAAAAAAASASSS